MRSPNKLKIRNPKLYLACTLLMAAGLAFSQTQTENPGPAVSQGASTDNADPAGPPAASAPDDQAPARGWPKADDAPGDRQGDYPQARPQVNAGYNNPGNDGFQRSEQSAYPQASVPPQLTIRPGTFVTVRIEQELSSDKNHPGDSFTASLAQPMIVNGIVVAQRGQTVGGRVGDARKAGRVEGVSRLGLQLTEISLVDGQQVPIESQFVSIQGQTSHGRDAAAIGGTTATGAAIGAAADGGLGAGIGAAAGAMASTVGVLLTRGHATVVYPETLLTFRILSPVIIATDRAPEAFRYAGSSDYSAPAPPMRATYSGPSYGCGVYGCPPALPPPYYYYGPSYYPAFYPGFAFYTGPTLFYGPGFYRGYRGGWYGGYHRGFRR
jgi:hypothetical protein